MHIGIIADGNRRWAKSKNLPTIEGHKKGLDTIETLVAAASKTDIKFLSFYVFSTENWGRSSEEVSYIMDLAMKKILGFAEKMQKQNIKLTIIGSREKVNLKLLKSIDKAEEMTKDCTGLTVGFCFNYGGEQEIADAAKALSLNFHHELGMNPSEQKIDEYFTSQNLAKYLYHPEIPPCDMIVRTSGEERISGFMLWRAAYSEFMFIDKYFPDMTADDLKNILEEYKNRNRRFGK